MKTSICGLIFVSIGLAKAISDYANSPTNENVGLVIALGASVLLFTVSIVVRHRQDRGKRQ